MEAVLLAVISALLCGVAIWLFLENQKLKARIAPILDIEAEIAHVKKSLQMEQNRFNDSVSTHKSQLASMNQQYQSNKKIFDRLQSEISVLEESLEIISYGLYKPHYDFEDTERYKNELDNIYERKKGLIKSGLAVICPNDWTVNGSVREGAKMIKQETKLMLRAFNAEVDAAVAKVTWNNISKMEERITKAFTAINDLGSVMQISVTKAYLDLCLSELRASFEFEMKKQEMKEEQRRIKEQIREEETAQREFEKAKKDAQMEETRYQKALEAARKELETAQSTELDSITKKVSELEEQLAQAREKATRATSMAQLTKSGHVYVISNIGSFGENVYKIGMTRRLDPTERVYELGDASVPFHFDIHAMIYSDDAPGLESAFHKTFDSRRLNMVNTRKEFFRLTRDEIEEFALTHHANIEFTKLAEAKEYRQTLSLLAPPPSKVTGQDTEELPATLVSI
ncbi:MAG: DUF4041 domain-containing protein [Candidatus Obscuribacterales bacterium]|jgi:cell division septum initiation protein DivIVA|nr:DUF4041 domain-containing protein [Candidatus Obscuribacterales bacterium]